MSDYLFLVPLSLLLGLVGLLAFLWSLHSDQYDDLDGAAARILDADDQPLQAPPALAGENQHDQSSDAI